VLERTLTPVMSAEQVVSLHLRLAERGVDWCVVGGWGVDALLGFQSREHKDLDVLLSLDALPASMDLLADEGFGLAYKWPESRAIPGRHLLLGEPLPSAFVLTHADGREIDVHVYGGTAEAIEILWDTARTLTPGDLAGSGTVAGTPMCCMTAAMQIICHEGYDLPPEQADDVLLLRQQEPRSADQ
jgi:lincosamide nucleotidyltransferase A/C/D/E